MRRVAPLVLLLFAFARDARAATVSGEPANVVVTQQGPKQIRIWLSVGSSTPCDSTANRKLYEGPMKPGDVLAVPFTEACACLEQTYDDFPDVGWGTSLLRCRPKVCTGWWCVPDTRVPLYFSIQSKRPPS